MRIGILTHPQYANYGGILQCYALSEYLKKLGYTPFVIKRENNRPFLLKRWIVSLLRFLRIPRYYHPNKVDRTLNMRPFVKQYLNLTHPVYNDKQIRELCYEYGLTAVIVGSDQVWRRSFALNYGYNYFLDFVPPHIIKASYAASFGLDVWDYTKEETLRIQQLLNKFSFISVREESAVVLLKNNLNINAEWVIDPTLLLTSDDYEKITSQRLINEKYVFVYWLGKKSLIENEIKKYQDKSYKIVEINLKEDRIQESIQDWLSYIKYADLVITDSFHGVVFSILFKKQFCMHKNDSGGNGRLYSLMKLLNISLDMLQSNKILDYKSLDNQLIYLRENAQNFLMKIMN